MPRRARVIRATIPGEDSGMTETSSLRDRTFLVQGATGGIGAALCEMLVEGGARLAVAGRDEGRVTELAGRLDAVPLVYDATDPAAVADGVETAVSKLGSLDGAANLVGSLLLKSAHTITPEEWREHTALNLDSAFYMVRAVAKPLQKSGGSVVLMSSAVARHGFAAHEVIGASKAGVIGLALSCAATYATRGVRFNCVAPGLTETKLTEPVRNNDAARKASLAMHPDGSFGEPGAVARAVAFLLDPASAHITGQVLAVDGGLGSVRSK